MSLIPPRPGRGRVIAAALLLALTGPAGLAHSAARPARPKPASARPAAPPPPVYPPRLASFPCKPGAATTVTTEQADPDRKPGGVRAGWAATRRVAGALGRTAASTVTDRFSITGEDGVFLCGQKVRDRLADRRAAREQPPPSSPARPEARRPELGLAAFADQRGDMAQSLILMDQTQRRLQSIVDRIASTWPYPDAPHPTVLIRADLQFNAKVTPDNIIIVNLGVFAPERNGTPNGMRDMDLYWLMAHEYAHVALGHSDKSESIFRNLKLLKGGTNFYLESAQLSSALVHSETNAHDPELAGRIRSAIRAHDHLFFVTKSLFEPAWGLENEDQADAAGLDLVLALGYYPTVDYVFERLDVTEDERKARLQQAEKIASSRLGDAVADPRFKAAMDSGNMGDAFGVVGENLKKGLFEFARKWFIGYITRSHRATDSRKAGIDAYRQNAFVAGDLSVEPKAYTEESAAILGSSELKEALTVANAVEASRAALAVSDMVAARAEIDKALRTRFQREPFVCEQAAEVALAENNKPAAIAYLETARQSKLIYPTVYLALTKLYVKGGQIARAQAVVDEGRKRTGDHDYFLPEDVMIALRKPDKEPVKALMKKCQDAMREEIANRCTAALLDFDWASAPEAQRKEFRSLALWGQFSLLGGLVGNRN